MMPWAAEVEHVFRSFVFRRFRFKDLGLGSGILGLHGE